MNGSQQQSMATPDLTAEAEALVRALRGVRRVRIDSDEHGVQAVHVTATDDAVAEQLAAHVRSALLAGLATPVVPGRIHVRVDGHDQKPPSLQTDGPSRGRLALVQQAPAPPATDQSLPADSDRSPLEAPDASLSDLPPTARPRLVSVDVDRPGDDRVVCRVAIAFKTHVHRAEAAAVDLPGAAAQAAAEAAVRALGAAGWEGLELLGLRDVELAGRDYILVALRRNDTSPRIRSASVPVIGSHERSAAEAAVAAAQETN